MSQLVEILRGMDGVSNCTCLPEEQQISGLQSVFPVQAISTLLPTLDA